MVDYDRSFAPYVVPGGSPFGRDALPDVPWAARMALGQVRGLLAVAFARARRVAPRVPLDRLEAFLVPRPEGHLPALGDAEFAYQRFAGTNPFSIRRVREVGEIPEKLRLDDDALRPLLGQRVTPRDGRPRSSARELLASRVARGDVMLLSHDVLRLRPETDLQPKKFVAPTSALFCHAPELDAPYPVVPLAIECPVGRADGETTVLTPESEARWRAAKALVGVADVHVSELCLHIARTHSMTTPFAIALRRRLAEDHPLHRFLLPHLRFCLFVDRMAWREGFRETTGVLLRSLAGEAAWSQEVAKSLYHQASFREQHFERDLAARGLAEARFDHPYRDDGRLLFAAILAFVRRFVDVTWPSEDALAKDAPVHDYLGEVASPDGGNVRGLFAEGRRVSSRDELCDVLAQVLFVAGPLHALAHYSGAAQLSSVDETPSWLVANPLATGVDARPGPFAGAPQISRVVSTNCRHDRLGDFSRYPLGEASELRDAVRAFQADLAAAEATIARRNETRLAPFVHFLPSRIPNGITV